MLRKLSVLSLFCVLALAFVFPISAQSDENISLGIANYVQIFGEDIDDGDIISSTEDVYRLSNSPYDPLVIGVVSTKPAVSLNITGSDESTYPVISAGNVRVNVTSINGNIKEGDLIASSQIPGAGMKATQTGYVIGRALDSFESANKEEIGSINIALNLHYSYSSAKTQSRLTDIFNLSALATYESPSSVFKYVVAGIIILISFILGIISFGRVANTGLEALGRNPLAGKMIQLGIVLNVLITVAIIAAGFGMAYIIIRL